MKLRLKVNRGRQSACESCGDKCHRWIYLRGHMKLHMVRNPFQSNECVHCLKYNKTRARRKSAAERVGSDHEQLYYDWVNEASPE